MRRVGAAPRMPRIVTLRVCVCRFVIFDAEGFKWFEVAPGGGAGKLRDAVAWTHVRGAARVGEWNRLFGVEVLHPGVKADVSILWCTTEVQRDEIVTAINSRK